MYNLYKQYSAFNFKSFNISEYNRCDFENEIDPNNNFYSNICTTCDYYTEEKCLKSETTRTGLSFIHFNARRRNTNFYKISDYVDDLKIPFAIIAISETCLESDEYTNMLLAGYRVIHRTRKNKKGGGVAIYVNDSI